MRGAIESAAPGAAWVLGVSNKISKCQNSFIKSHHVTCPPLIISPPAAPHIPQGRPQIPANFAFGTSLAASFRFGAAFFRLLVDFWMPQKSYKKRLQKNMPQNLQSRAPDHQNVDFGIDFGTLLASFFHQFFDSLIKCANHQNAFVHSSSVA